MKAILLTIRLKYFYLTYKGIKTIEIRKFAPKDFVGDVYEVVSKTNFEKDLMEIPENERDFFKKFVGKVGLKFTLNMVEEIPVWKTYLYANKETCLSNEEIKKYLDVSLIDFELDENYVVGYAWHIDNLVIFDKPKELDDFYKVGAWKIYEEQFDSSYIKRTEKEIMQSLNQVLTKAPRTWCYIEV